eukprot:TRINITY_DN3520_c0_g5_i1.p1 TRINITY_DN3520_c0_g5~~TRINITY_DN3520_c0_g5_i1.p1  ORF type:complete len:151 (-),score=39.37 TRINITY_DN3520_c0_g5_i1:166-618(-)
MLFYFILCRPFKNTLNNVLNIYNEFTIFLCFGLILILNLFPPSTNMLNACGYVILVFIAVGFVMCWVAMGIGVAKQLKENKAVRKKSAESNKEAKEDLKDAEKIRELNKEKVKTATINATKFEVIKKTKVSTTKFNRSIEGMFANKKKPF